MANSDLFGETPTQLIPKMGEFPVSNSAFYKQLVMTDAAGSTDEGTALNGQLDPFSGGDSFEDRPATGVLLTFEQQWYQEGLALGELRKSLCLAPGEVTKLAVVDWRRETASRETSERSQSEAVRSEMNDASAAVQIQRAVANEAKSGMSSSSATATHTEASGGVSFLFWGASASSGSSSQQGYAATSSTGSRDVASSASKDIERRTEQLAQSTRSARATQIRELTENEQQSTTTRVVANYNHAHALTMQYYEVLQIYSVRTRVVQARRCVFIPMKPFEFNEAALTVADDTVIELLRRVLRDLGAVEVDEMVGNLHGKAPGLDQTIKECEAKRDAVTLRLRGVEADLSELKQRLDAASANHEAAQLALRNAASGSGGFKPDASNIQLLTVSVIQTQVALAQEQVRFLGDKNVAEATRTGLNKELEAIETELARKLKARSELGRVFGILDQHRLLLNQQMWMLIDDYAWHRKLAGKTYPDTPYKGQPLGSLVDPTPVGYFGNYVAFAWDFPRSLAAEPDDQSEAEAFEEQFTNNTSTRTRIALPTEGVFAEAVLGQSNSAEKIDITRFWNWQDSPIPILPPSMAPVGTQSRARDVAMPTPLTFAPALAALRDAGVPPDIKDDALLGALQNSLLGDNAALIAAAATAGLNASDNASEGAGRAGQQVVDAMKNVQDFTVGLANSEVAKIATQAVSSGATGGMSAVGGLLNAASEATRSVKFVDQVKKKPQLRKNKYGDKVIHQSSVPESSAGWADRDKPEGTRFFASLGDPSQAVGSTKQELEQVYLLENMVKDAMVEVAGIAARLKIGIAVRGTNIRSHMGIESGAPTKAREFKNKTANEIDLLICDEMTATDLGTVVHFDPRVGWSSDKPGPDGRPAQPADTDWGIKKDYLIAHLTEIKENKSKKKVFIPKTDKDWSTVKRRFEQRVKEYINEDKDYRDGGAYANHAAIVGIHLRIKVNGTVTGNMVGDHDLFGFTSPTTHEFLKKENKRAQKLLQASNMFQAQHGGIWYWDPHAEKDKNIKDVIMGAHGPGGDEPLVYFCGKEARPVRAVFYIKGENGKPDKVESVWKHATTAWYPYRPDGV